ncbi:MAG: hypothetical protein JSW66_14515 [Phycisphaerales bacterium]|nr:MAG: hypothetical protein JSW66_14515 [Phycisphaerales bacterium]
MGKLRRIFVLMLIAAVVSLGVTGCESKSEQPNEEHPTSEHPTEEAPSEEHPSSEHPSGEHPQ